MAVKDVKAREIFVLPDIVIVDPLVASHSTRLAVALLSLASAGHMKRVHPRSLRPGALSDRNVLVFHADGLASRDLLKEADELVVYDGTKEGSWWDNPCRLVWDQYNWPVNSRAEILLDALLSPKPTAWQTRLLLYIWNTMPCDGSPQDRMEQALLSEESLDRMSKKCPDSLLALNGNLL